MITRRTFMQIVAAGIGALYIPPSLGGEEDKILVSDDWGLFDQCADAFVRAWNSQGTGLDEEWKLIPGVVDSRGRVKRGLNYDGLTHPNEKNEFLEDIDSEEEGKTGTYTGFMDLANLTHEEARKRILRSVDKENPDRDFIPNPDSY